jgi:DNA-binding NtrC family response regulator
LETTAMRILLLDAGPALSQLSADLADAGHAVQRVPDLAAARAALACTEVEAVVCDARLLDGDVVQPPQDAAMASAQPNALRAQVRRFEAQVILRALEDADGDRRVAAQRLGIGLSSLYRKIEELDIREQVRAAH